MIRSGVRQFRLAYIFTFPFAKIPVSDEVFAALQRQMQQLLTVNANAPAQATNRIEGARMPKIPPFIQTDSDLWYLQVEARFRNTNITVDSTKVDYICPSLGGEALSAIGDIIKKDPLLRIYTNRLKNASFRPLLARLNITCEDF